MPQIEYGRASHGLLWPLRPRHEFYTRSPDGHIDVGLPLSNVYNSPGDFGRSESNLVGGVDYVHFGDRRKVTQRLEVRRAAGIPVVCVSDIPHWQVMTAGRFVSWARQTAACRSTTNSEPLTLQTVACHIAKTVWECIQSFGGQWTLYGGTVVRYEDLVILELVQVTRGSHQIVLGYFEPPQAAEPQMTNGVADIGNLWNDLILPVGPQFARNDLASVRRTVHYTAVSLIQSPQLYDAPTEQLS